MVPLALGILFFLPPGQGGFTPGRGWGLFYPVFGGKRRKTGHPERGGERFVHLEQ